MDATGGHDVEPCKVPHAKCFRDLSISSLFVKFCFGSHMSDMSDMRADMSELHALKKGPP